MATRFYFPVGLETESSVTPSFSGSWNRTSDADRLWFSPIKQNTTQTTKVSYKNVSTNPYNVLTRQYISDPLEAQDISGNVKGQICVSESSSSGDFCRALLIKVVSGDGSVVRGTLLSDFPASLTPPSIEFNTILENRNFPLSTALSLVTAVSGDRIVVEIGSRSFSSSSSNTINHVFGDSGGFDLPEDNSSVPGPDPWLEFSQDINFVDRIRADQVIGQVEYGNDRIIVNQVIGQTEYGNDRIVVNQLTGQLEYGNDRIIVNQLVAQIEYIKGADTGGYTVSPRGTLDMSFIPSAESVNRYSRLLQSLLPIGKLWNRAEYSNLTNLMLGLGVELARVDSLVDDLVEEARVSTATNLLPNHELDYNIPNAYEPLKTTPEERRLVLLGKQNTLGGQNRQYFIDVASSMNLDAIIISRSDGFLCGRNRCGDRIGGGISMYYWIVLLKYNHANTTFGSSGDLDLGGGVYASYVSLPSYINMVEKFKPAHTIVLWDWWGPGFSNGFSNGFDSEISDGGDPLQIPSYWEGGFSKGFGNGFTIFKGIDSSSYFNGGFSSGFSVGFHVINYAFSY